MSYKVDESKLMAYLYDELSADEKIRVEEYLKENETAQKELEESKETRFLIGKLNDREVEVPKFTFDQSEVVVGASGTRHNWWRYPLGIAASIALVLFVGYLTSFRISTGEEGLTIAFGDRNTSEVGYSKAQIEQLIGQALIANNETINQRLNTSENAMAQKVSNISQPQVDEALLNKYMARLRDFNKETLAHMLESSDQSQKEYTNRALQDLVIYLDIQRQNDLELIQTQFENFENNAEINQLQTNQILTSLINTAEVSKNQY